MTQYVTSYVKCPMNLIGRILVLFLVYYNLIRSQPVDYVSVPIVNQAPIPGQYAPIPVQQIAPPLTNAAVTGGGPGYPPYMPESPIPSFGTQSQPQDAIHTGGVALNLVVNAGPGPSPTYPSGPVSSPVMQSGQIPTPVLQSGSVVTPVVQSGSASSVPIVQAVAQPPSNEFHSQPAPTPSTSNNPGSSSASSNRDHGSLPNHIVIDGHQYQLNDGEDLVVLDKANSKHNGKDDGDHHKRHDDDHDHDHDRRHNKDDDDDDDGDDDRNRHKDRDDDKDDYKPRKKSSDKPKPKKPNINIKLPGIPSAPNIPTVPMLQTLDPNKPPIHPGQNGDLTSTTTPAAEAGIEGSGTETAGVPPTADPAGTRPTDQPIPNKSKDNVVVVSTPTVKNSTSDTHEPAEAVSASPPLKDPVPEITEITPAESTTPVPLEQTSPPTPSETVLAVPSGGTALGPAPPVVKSIPEGTEVVRAQADADPDNISAALKAEIPPPSAEPLPDSPTSQAMMGVATLAPLALPQSPGQWAAPLPKDDRFEKAKAAVASRPRLAPGQTPAGGPAKPLEHPGQVPALPNLPPGMEAFHRRPDAVKKGPPVPPMPKAMMPKPGTKPGSMNSSAPVVALNAKEVSGSGTFPASSARPEVAAATAPANAEPIVPVFAVPETKPDVVDTPAPIQITSAPTPEPIRKSRFAFGHTPEYNYESSDGEKKKPAEKTSDSDKKPESEKKDDTDDDGKKDKKTPKSDKKSSSTGNPEQTKAVSDMFSNIMGKIKL